MSRLPTIFRLAAATLLAAPQVPAAGAAEAAPAVPPPPTAAWVANLFNSWRAPVPPRRLVGNIHYVGASGVSAFLITTPAGHILLDTGFDDTVPIIERGVAQLGFKVADIRLLLSSHAHVDHAGGHARMKQLTGARVVASAADARLLESGGAEDFLRWPRDTIRYEPVRVDRVVADGEEVELGGVRLTARLTPGHTRGATTWTMDVVEAGRTYRVAFFSSASVNAGTRLLGNPDYPDIAAELERSFGRWKELRPDIYFAPHGGQFAMADKFARADRGEGAAAFVDPMGWDALLAAAEKDFRDQLAAERAAAK